MRITVLNHDCPNAEIIKEGILAELDTDGNYIINCLLTNTVVNSRLQAAVTEFSEKSTIVGCVNSEVYSMYSDKCTIIPYAELQTIAKKMEYVLYGNTILVRTNIGCAGSCTYCNICEHSFYSYPIELIMGSIDSIIDDSVETIFLVSLDNSIYSYDGLDILDIAKLIYTKYKRRVSIQSLSVSFCRNHLDKVCKGIESGYLAGVGISAQSGSESVLKTMNRNYSGDNIITVAHAINRVKPPGFILYSEFLYGFHGEDDKELFKSLKVATIFDYVIWYRYRQLLGSESQKLFPDLIEGDDSSKKIYDFARVIHKDAMIVGGQSFMDEYKTKGTPAVSWLIKR
jgi:tRNA A37 methylthiotransferase MiaB